MNDVSLDGHRSSLVHSTHFGDNAGESHSSSHVCRCAGLCWEDWCGYQMLTHVQFTGWERRRTRQNFFFRNRQQLLYSVVIYIWTLERSATYLFKKNPGSDFVRVVEKDVIGVLYSDWYTWHARKRKAGWKIWKVYNYSTVYMKTMGIMNDSDIKGSCRKRRLPPLTLSEESSGDVW